MQNRADNMFDFNDYNQARPTPTKEQILGHFGGNFHPFYEKYLPNLKPLKGDEWRSVCPFHDDREPSLNVNAKTGLFYCHGCGKKGDIFHFYGKVNGLVTGPDFHKILKGIASDFGILGSGSKPTAPGRIVATYDYTDAAGDLLFQVCRMEPKSFRQRRPDGKNRWVWSLKGIEPVLYRLPELLTADEILLVEGEKDVENARKLGFTATTCPMGAGKWRDSYSEALRGKDVILLPDNDEPGRKHMLAVAGALHGVANSVRLLVLPGLPDKGDVSDFIETFSDPSEAAERISIMAEGAEPWEPAEEDPLADLLACAVTEEYCQMLGEEQWIFQNLIIKNQIIVIIAKSGGGKTTIFYNFVCPWILRNHPDIQILYLDCDSPASDHKMMKSLEKKMGNRFCWLNPVTHGKNAAFMIEKLRKIAAARKRLENKIFILDTLKKFLNLMDKSSAKPFFELLRELISLGATIVLLGHANKYRDKEENLVFEGVGDIQNDADALIFFERITAPDGQDITTVVDPDKGAKVRGLFEPISFHITLPDRVVTQNKDVVAIPDWGVSPKGKKLTDDEIFEIVRAYLAGQRDYVKQAALVAAMKGIIAYHPLLKVLAATTVPEADATTPGQIIFATGFRNAKTYSVMRPYP